MCAGDSQTEQEGVLGSVCVQLIIAHVILNLVYV